MVDVDYNNQRANSQPALVWNKNNLMLWLYSWWHRHCYHYLRQGGYVIVVLCLSVCLLAALCKNCCTDLHEIFREDWPVSKWLHFGGDLDHWSGYGSGSYPDLDCDTGKMCLGGGMHCPSASSPVIMTYVQVCSFVGSAWRLTSCRSVKSSSCIRDSTSCTATSKTSHRMWTSLAA